MCYIRHPNTKCQICGKPIYKRPGEIRENHGNVFCSSICYGKSNIKTHPCIVCGKAIQSHFNKKTCSHACANVNRAGIKYKLHLPRKDRVRNHYMLKLRLLKTKGDKCERCGYNKKEILQVHHKDKNRENNNLLNLELICPNCHYEIHAFEKNWLRSYN